MDCIIIRNHKDKIETDILKREGCIYGRRCYQLATEYLDTLTPQKIAELNLEVIKGTEEELSNIQFDSDFYMKQWDIVTGRREELKKEMERALIGAYGNERERVSRINSIWKNLSKLI